MPSQKEILMIHGMVILSSMILLIRIIKSINIDNENTTRYFEDPFINHWFCSELVWASYLNAHIQLDKNPSYTYHLGEERWWYRVKVDDLKHPAKLSVYNDFCYQN